MNDYPKMLYRGTYHDDWQKLGASVHAGRVESIIVQDLAEETEYVKAGFGHLSELMKAPKRVAQPAQILTQAVPIIPPKVSPMHQIASALREMGDVKFRSYLPDWLNRLTS